MTTESADNSESWTVHIKSLSQRKEIIIPASCNVAKLREVTARDFEVDESQTCLIFGGKILKDEEMISDHGVHQGSTVHLVIRPKKPTPQPSNNAKSNASSSSSIHVNNDQQRTSLNGGETANPSGIQPNPFLTNPFHQASFADIQQNFYQTVRNDPNSLQSLLNNPMFQSVMNNPELIRALMMSNPQMQRVLEQNPEIAQVFNNPEFLRQTMEMIRNPTTLQEMMRNHDRALINLESLPGGYNALQRLYRDFQEPMMNATQEQFGYNPLNQDSSSPSRPGTSQHGTENTTPMPNPWTSSRQQPGAATSPLLLNSLAGLSPSGGAPASSGSTATATNSSTNSTSLSSMLDSPRLLQLLSEAAQNPQLISAVLSSPEVSSAFQNYTQNPELFRNLLASNPLLQNNPQLANNMVQTLQNLLSQWTPDDFRSLLSNPDALNAIIQIQQGLLRLQAAAPAIFSKFNSSLTNLSPTAATPTGMVNEGNARQAEPTTAVPSSGSGSGTSESLVGVQLENVQVNPDNSTEAKSSTNLETPSANNPPASSPDSRSDYTSALLQLLHLFSNSQQSAQQSSSSTSQSIPSTLDSPFPNPEVRFATELEQMQSMGFSDRSANLRALIECMGDVNLAVERILDERQRGFFGGQGSNSGGGRPPL